MSGELKVFFALQFKSPYMTKIDKDNALVEAMKEVDVEITREFPDYKLDWQESRLESGRQIGEQIVELVKASDIFIADISEYNPNVLFELGVARGLQCLSHKKIIWLSHEEVDLSQIPSDLRGLYIDRYNGNNLKPLLAYRILNLSRSILKERAALDRMDDARNLWGLPQEGNVDIVCSEIPEEERHYFADPNDRNYLRYAKFADLDSLIYVRTRIAQLFPREKIRDFSPSEYYDTNTQALIVIGGPAWNSKFRDFQSSLPFHFIERPLGEDDLVIIDLEPMDGYIFKPIWNQNRSLIKDISIFARIQVSKDLPVFLLAGCLTFGVLGAAKCFLDEDCAPSNAKYIMRYIKNRDFILVCETSRLGHFTKTPSFTTSEPLVVLARETDGHFSVIMNNAKDYKQK